MNAEDQMLCAIFRWRDLQVHLHPELQLMYHVPNERKLSAAQGALENRKGRTKGVPDIQLDVARGGYHGLRIELKTAKGNLSCEQEKWGDLLSQQGYRWVVCRSFESAIAEISTYLGIRSCMSAAF